MSKISEIYSEKEMNERLCDAIDTENALSLVSVSTPQIAALADKARQVAIERVRAVIGEYLQWHEEVEAAGLDPVWNGEQS